jgi:hypothetical protein
MQPLQLTKNRCGSWPHDRPRHRQRHLDRHGPLRDLLRGSGGDRVSFQDLDFALVLLALITGLYVADIPRAYRRRRLEREFSPEREKLRNMERYLGGKR